MSEMLYMRISFSVGVGDRAAVSLFLENYT